MGLSLPVKFTI